MESYLPQEEQQKARNAVRDAVPNIQARMEGLSEEAQDSLTLCAITQAPSGVDFIRYAWLVPQATKPTLIRKLEWCWGLGHQTFDVNSAPNIQTLTISFNNWFSKFSSRDDQGTWFWVPTGEDVAQIREGLDPSGNGVDEMDVVQIYGNATRFHYTLVATTGMSESWDFRIYQGSYSAMDPTRFNYINYPFKDQPIHRLLHVHPHLSIVNAGMKLDVLLGEPNDDSDPNVYSRLVGYEDPDDPMGVRLLDIHRLYHAWMSAEVPKEWAESRPGMTRQVFLSEQKREPYVTLLR